MNSFPTKSVCSNMEKSEVKIGDTEKDERDVAGCSCLVFSHFYMLLLRNLASISDSGRGRRIGRYDAHLSLTRDSYG